MQEDKSSLMSFAMQSGVYLGVFWVVKYFFVMFAGDVSSFQFFVQVLSALTPIILLHFLIKYRLIVLDNNLGFWHGMKFSIMLFFFASLFESVAAYIHVTWVDPAFVSTLYEQMADLLRGLNISESMISSFEKQPIPDSFGYIINHVILSDVFIGIALSIFVVPISKMINPKNITKKQSDRNE